MRTAMKRVPAPLAGGIALCLALLCSPAAAQVRYSVIDLGTLGGAPDYASALGINDAGQVVGLSRDKRGHDRAIIFDRTHGMRSLGLLPGAPKDGSSTALHIDSAGGIVGYASGPHCKNLCQHAFYLPPAAPEMIDLGLSKKGNSTASWSNRKGRVGGFAESQAVIWRSDRDYEPQIVQGLPGYDKHAVVAINDSGFTVGASESTLTGACAAWVLQDQQAQDIGKLSGTCATPTAVNRHGAVIGFSTTDAPSGVHPFLWTAGQGMIDLGLVGIATSGTALGINDRNEVVGTATNNLSFVTAFLYVPGVGAQDLNQMIPPESGVLLSRASGINSHGEICANGWDANLDQHAFLLVPLP